MVTTIRQQRVLVETPNTKLEALVYINPGRRHGAAAIICHPYALLGGSMHDAMVTELFRAVACSKAFSCVMRYNQRGVGQSAGRMNVRGREDMGDVLDVVEFAAAQLEGPDPQVVVIGYSWGSCLAAYALSHPAVVAYVGVSFPLGGLSWVLQTKKHFGEVARASHVPRLLLLGDQDQFTKEAALRQAVLEGGGCLLRQDDSFEPEADAAAAAGAAPAAGQQQAVATPAGARSAAPAARTGSPGSSSGGSASGSPAGSLPGAQTRELLLRVFPGSDHFWVSEGSVAAQYVVAWLETLLQQRQKHREEAAAAGSDSAESDADADADAMVG